MFNLWYHAPALVVHPSRRMRTPGGANVANDLTRRRLRSEASEGGNRFRWTDRTRRQKDARSAGPGVPHLERLLRLDRRRLWPGNREAGARLSDRARTAGERHRRYEDA